MSSISLPPNSRFAGDFTIVRELDRGGMGVIYDALQISTQRHRALKVMLPELAQSVKYREYFLREATVGSRIASKHIVEVVTAGYDEPTASLWLAMEFLLGETLEKRVQGRGPLTPTELLGVYRQVGHALSAAHRVGVVHCDLKPENVFICESQHADFDSTVKLLDFGIAKVVQEYRTSVIAAGFEGSPSWMAPEQAVPGGRIKAATDVWSLGVLAFHLLTGKFYWRHAQVPTGFMPLMTEVLVSDLETASRRAREHGFTGTLPKGFDAWFARCVVRDVDRRFAEVTEAVDALAALCARPSVVPSVPGTVLLPEGDGEANALRMSMLVAERDGNLVGAVQFGERLVARPSPDGEDVERLRRVLLALARAEERAGDRASALARADRAVSLGEADPWARHLRSTLRLRAGDVAGALQDLADLTVPGVLPTSIAEHQARVWHLAGHHEASASMWAWLSSAQPSNASYLVGAGVAWVGAREWSKAEEAFTRAIELAPADAATWWQRGVVRAERGGVAGAKSDLDEAVRLAPERGEGWYERCRLTRRLGDVNGAWSDLARAAACGHPLAIIELAGTTATD